MSEADVEAALKDVELNEVETEPEKLPMNSDGGGGGDSNGALKAKAAEAEPGAEQPFTGLSKEQLLKVANTPGWVRLRWALLLLFWLGWLAMLAGAVAIIVKAPRCKALPDLRWWQRGPLYQIQVGAFQDTRGRGHGDLAGVEQRLEEIAALKVKGIVIGPIHRNNPDRIAETRLTEIDDNFGDMSQFESLLTAAHRKGIKVILDLTPNYRGTEKWFGLSFNETGGDPLQEKEAFKFWLQKGVDGLRLGAIETVLNSAPNRVAEWQNLTRSFSEDEQQRVLVIAATNPDPDQILQLLKDSEVDLVFSNYLRQALSGPGELSAAVVHRRVQQHISSSGNRTWPSWAVSGSGMGHLATMKGNLTHLLPVMLLTLPGTPFIYYGDEIGLRGDTPDWDAWMLWNSSVNAGFTSKESSRLKPDIAQTVEGQKSDSNSLLSLFKKLGLLKAKERSLQFGEFRPLHTKDSVYAYLRSWDQSNRFLVLLNFGSVATTVSLEGREGLPAVASVELSSLPPRSEDVRLEKVSLAAGEALVLKFPYVP